MRIQVKTYYSASSLIHRADVRAKIVLLALATLGLFLISSLGGMLLCLLAMVFLAVFSRVPACVYRPFLPLALVFAFSPLVFNGLSLDVAAAQETLNQYYGVSSDNLPPIILTGTFGIVPAGVLHGLMMGLRIFLLIFLSLLFTFTTEADEVVKAIAWFLAPLGRLGVPVRDIATVFSLVLRFIPLIAQELSTVADAHRGRGARLDSGTPFERMKAWGNVFIPLFVRLFRRAETLSIALDARCHGASTMGKAAKRQTERTR